MCKLKMRLERTWDGCRHDRGVFNETETHKFPQKYYTGNGYAWPIWAFMDREST